MATPEYPSRRYYACGTKRHTVWGTAVAITGPLDGILMKGDSGLALNQKYEPYPAVDQIMPMNGALGILEPSEFTPPVDLQYEMGAWGRWLAALFGTAGVPATLGGGAGRKHTFQWADSVTHFFTYAEERTGKIWEVASAMPYKLNLKLSGAQIAAAITLRGNTLIDDSVTNTDTQMTAITYADRGNFVNFIHGSFLMNAQAAATLSNPTDKVDISDFELNLERSIDSVHVAGLTNIAEPKEGEFPKNNFKITLPRASAANAAYFTTFKALTPLKGLLSFVGALCATPYYYTVSFYFPQLRLVSAPDIKLDGIMKNEMVFEIEQAGAAVNGMLYVRPYAEITNLQTTDYLA